MTMNSACLQPVRPNPRVEPTAQSVLASPEATSSGNLLIGAGTIWLLTLKWCGRVTSATRVQKLMLGRGTPRR